MLSIAPILMIVAFLAFAVFAIVFGIQQANKRREAMHALALELGLGFNPKADHHHDDQYAHFEMFRMGSRRAAFNTMVGQTTINGEQMGVKAGDFRYTVSSGSGKDRKTTTHTFSYIIIHLPYHNAPDLLIRPENVFDKIAGVFSNRDIDFESEEFSRKFLVASPDRKFAYDVCHPRMMEFLLQSKPPAIDIEHARLCLAEGSRTWTPEQFRWMIGFASQFLGHWPDHVINDLRAAS